VIWTGEFLRDLDRRAFFKVILFLQIWTGEFLRDLDRRVFFVVDCVPA
jgi:hypothetical protein